MKNVLKKFGEGVDVGRGPCCDAMATWQLATQRLDYQHRKIDTTHGPDAENGHQDVMQIAH